jgi:quinol monooxygenase YgiN
MIHVIAAIQAKPGQRDLLVRAFRQILARVQAKPGCLEYGLALHTRTDLAGQAPYDDDVVTLVEKWTDLEALQRHLADATFLDWLASQWHMVQSASMQILDAL